MEREPPVLMLDIDLCLSLADFSRKRVTQKSCVLGDVEKLNTCSSKKSLTKIGESWPTSQMQKVSNQW